MRGALCRTISTCYYKTIISLIWYVCSKEGLPLKPVDWNLDEPCGNVAFMITHCERKKPWRMLPVTFGKILSALG